MCERKLKTSLSAHDLQTVQQVEARYGVEVLEAVYEDGGMQPTLINGRPVPRQNWPEVTRISVTGGCTATLVGPNCAVTAAHCGRNGATGNLEMYDGTKIPFTVFQMPQYQEAGATHDLSLLKLHREVSITQFAEFGFNHVFTVGQQVLLAGYGCTQPGGTGGNDGILRIGPSKIVGATNPGTDVISQWVEMNGGALCFGDSGGPMFKSEATAGSRVLIAVNSKGNIRDTNYNMKLNLPEVRTFVTETANREGLKITGLNFGAGGGGGQTDAKQALAELVREMSDVQLKIEKLRQVIGS